MWSVWIKAWHHHNLPRQISHKTRRAKDRLTQSAEALDSELKGCLGAPTRVCKRTLCQSQGPGTAGQHWKQDKPGINILYDGNSTAEAYPSGARRASSPIQYQSKLWDDIQVVWIKPQTERASNTHLPSHQTGSVWLRMSTLLCLNSQVICSEWRDWRKGINFCHICSRTGLREGKKRAWDLGWV